jgi:hypothetical protein
MYESKGLFTQTVIFRVAPCTLMSRDRIRTDPICESRGVRHGTKRFLCKQALGLSNRRQTVNTIFAVGFF